MTDCGLEYQEVKWNIGLYLQTYYTTRIYIFIYIYQEKAASFSDSRWLLIKWHLVLTIFKNKDREAFLQLIREVSKLSLMETEERLILVSYMNTYHILIR